MVLSKIPHGEGGRNRTSDRLDDVIRSHVSRPALRRSRASADDPDVGRSRGVQLCGVMAELQWSQGGPRLPHLRRCRWVSVSADRHRRPVRPARPSVSRHPTSHPVTWSETVSGAARRDRPSCGQHRYSNRHNIHHLLAALLGLSGTRPSIPVLGGHPVELRGQNLG